MSRSYKKPWVKDSSNSYMKKIHSRRSRRITHQIVDLFCKTFDLSSCTEMRHIPTKHEVSNQYDICDWIFKDSSPRGTRK